MIVIVVVGAGVTGVAESASILIVNCFEAVNVPLEALTVKVYVPAVVGVPYILPSLLRRSNSEFLILKP